MPPNERLWKGFRIGAARPPLRAGPWLKSRVWDKQPIKSSYWPHIEMRSNTFKTGL